MQRRALSFLSAPLLLAACTSVIDDPGTGEDPSLATVTAEIEVVPPALQCLRVTLTGSTNASRNFPITAGAASLVSIGNVNPGVVTIRARAYTLACDSGTTGVTGSTPYQWGSDNVTVDVSEGLTTRIGLTLRPRSELEAEIDFVRPARSVVVGGRTAFAILEDGAVMGWGENDAGQLGEGTTTSRLQPVEIPAFAGAVQLATSGSHTCALWADGRARCVGRGTSGELGDGSSIDQLVPVTVSVPGVSFTGLATGLDPLGRGFSCAAGSDARVYCWGSNAYGVLGASPAILPSLAVPRLIEDVPVVPGGIAVGVGFAAAVSRTGNVTFWGLNARGAFGAGDRALGLRSDPVFGVSFIPATAVHGGADFACAETPTRTVRCSGDNFAGKLGTGSLTPDRTVDAVPALVTDVRDLAVGSEHTCAATGDGLVLCWGFGPGLGDGRGDPQPTPTAAFELDGVTDVSAGSAVTCARKTDGTVWCWGVNSSGAVGDGSGIDRYVPARVKI